MIAGFILPERLPHASRQEVGGARGRSLDPPGDLRQPSKWPDYQVYVVGHDDPGEPLIQSILVLSPIQRFDDKVRDPGILQPKWAARHTIQQAIGVGERPAGIAGRLGRSATGRE